MKDSAIPVRREAVCEGAALEAVLDRMARETSSLIANRPQVALVGILRRGLPLAQRLQSRIATLPGGRTLPVLPLELKRYADDLTLLHPDTALTESGEIAALDLANTTVVLVDDVLYGGFSLLRAVSWLVQHGARDVLAVVLVDRGEARLPVRADVSGLRLKVGARDIVECCVPPYEPRLQVAVCRRPESI